MNEPTTGVVPELGAEFTQLESLVDHRESVPADALVEEVYERFRQHGHEFVAVVEDLQFIGFVSRGQVGFLLGARSGFATHGCHAIRDHLMPSSLVVRQDSPLEVVIEDALARTGEDFYNDVALVDPDGGFLGVITVQTLVRLQSRILLEQKRLAEQQRLELAQRNQELFQSVSELRQSKGHYKALFHDSALGIGLLNGRGEIEKHNQRFAKILKLGDAGNAPRQNLADWLQPEERAAFLQLLRQHAASAGDHPVCEHEFTLHPPAGTPRRFEFFTSWIHETGQVCAQIHDITEQRALERKIAQKEKSALFDSLVGGIAHELNNKLTPVLGYAELLSRKFEDNGAEPEPLHYCEVILQSAREAAKIVRQLLELSRPSVAKMSRCDLGALVAEISGILRYRLRATGAKLHQVEPQQSVVVFADGPQLKQVVMNLMLNALDAVEHAERQELTTSLRIEGENAVLSVSDTGHGIKPEHLNRIFDPFFTTKAPDRGTGLGLSVCLSIVRQHHGEILVRSVPGQGSVFEVVLPLARGQISEGSSPPSAAPRGATPANYSGIAVQSRLEIIVVDDEESVTSLVEEVLRRQLKCRVERVHHGRHAIDRLSRNRFDLVITDVRMPEIDGLALLEWIKAIRPSLIRRTLCITGETGSAAMEAEVSTLGVPVLHKPFTSEALLDHCQRLLKAPRVGDDLRGYDKGIGLRDRRFSF